MAGRIIKRIETRVEKAEERISARREAVRSLSTKTPSERRVRTQELLLDAGLELMAEKGIGATSVGDICSRAGFTRGAFYSNFTDMDHFVHLLADHQWSNITQMIETTTQARIEAEQHSSELSHPRTETELDEAIADFVLDLLEAFPDSPSDGLLVSEFSMYVSRNPGSAVKLRESYDQFKSAVGKLVEDGIRSMGRKYVMSPSDSIEIIFSLVERSMRLAATTNNANTLEFFQRTMPVVLKNLTEPIGNSAGE